MSFLRWIEVCVVFVIALIGAVALVFLFVIALSVQCHAATRHGTFAYDYRNTPTVAPLEGFEAVVLAARATEPAKVDSVHAWGGKAYALVQPTLAAWNGAPWENSPYDAALWRAARATDGVLRTASGDTLWMFAGQPYRAAIWDLTNEKFGTELVGIVSGLPADGIVLDYGCPWIDAPLTDAQREGFAAGWRSFVDGVRAARNEPVVCQCDQLTASATPDRCDGLLLERVGQSLNPPAKVWRQVTSDPESRFLLRQEDTNASRRRLFAGIALLTDGLFSQVGDPNRTPPVNLKPPEFWSLALGYSGGGWFARFGAPDLYQRVFSRGLVIVNLGTSSYRYAYSSTAAYTISPNDALILQNRDARGRFIPPLTTGVQ